MKICIIASTQAIIPGASWFHGSPNADIKEASNIQLLFLTQNRKVAVDYSESKVHFASKFSGARAKPTLYEYSLRPGIKIFDMRKASELQYYSELRVTLNRTPGYLEDPLPRVSSEGFIQSKTGLPSYGRIITLSNALGGKYDAVYVDEGSQGISLAIFNPSKSLRLLSKTSP